MCHPLQRPDDTEINTVYTFTMSIIQENINLKSLNTFGIDAKTRYFASIQNINELKELLSHSLYKNSHKLILGGGSNILFTSDFPGLVIKNDIKKIQILSEDDMYIWIEVGAGENWHEFVTYCVANGYAGIENLSLIPGTVGAAPIQNIGAYGVELCDVFSELKAFDLKSGNVITFLKEECGFGYRDSVFKNNYKNKFMILSVTLRLNKVPIFHTQYGNIQETLEKMQIEQLNIKAISDAVIKIRRSKLPDPKELGNAGSFFKNPIISMLHFVELKKKFPNIPSFPISEEQKVKIPAGWLIEQCGWKGKRFGDIGVYDKQALIMVNFGNGSGADIQHLAHKIQLSVKKQFEIELSPEVNLI